MKIQRILASAALAFALTACSAGGPPVPETDTVELARKDVTSKVSVSASIDSQEVIALTTGLTGPVTDVAVHVGQPVQEGQIVARLDTSAPQRQLDAQRAQQVASDVAAQNELERAQQQYAQQQEALGRGLNQRITAAEAAQREAQVRFDEAQGVYDQRRAQVEAGQDPELVQLASAVDQARRGVTTAGLDSVRANIASLLAGMTGQIDQLNPVVGLLESDVRYTGAQRDLDAAQRAYEAALHAVDADLEAKQRAVGQAFAAKNDADIALEVTRLSVQHELAAAASGVDQAQRSANASALAAEVGQNQLQVDVASGEVRSPINGVVTEVIAQRGQPANGHLVTVADPARLILTANVNEVDSGRVQPGNEVTFTTPSTGMKQFTGRVLEVSPVAAPAPGGAAGAGAAGAGAGAGGGSTPRPEFPVRIEVTGDTEGLRLGGSAKGQIVTGTAREVLTVPREAIVDKNGSYSVLYLDGETIKEAEVTLGLVTDLEAEVHGLEEGTRVITKPGDYRDRVAQ